MCATHLAQRKQDPLEESRRLEQRLLDCLVCLVACLARLCNLVADLVQKNQLKEALCLCSFQI